MAWSVSWRLGISEGKGKYEIDTMALRGARWCARIDVVTLPEDHPDGNAEILVGFRAGEVSIAAEREDGARVQAVLTPDGAEKLAQLIIKNAADARAHVDKDEVSESK